MVEFLFSLRFQLQLRRTRPALFTFIEHSIVDAVTRSGGKIGFEQRCIAASFEGLTIGFWLDMLIVLESVFKTLEEAAPELYGYRCLLGRDLGDYRASLFRALPVGVPGFWCDPSVQRDLGPYIEFERSLDGAEVKPGVRGFARIRGIRDLGGAPRPPSCGEQVQQVLRTGKYRNAVILGPRFIGKRDGLHRYCASLLAGAPPLVIRFGSGGTGLCCFADAYNSPVRSFISRQGGAEPVKELDALVQIILRDRLRNQYSSYLLFKAQRFLILLLESYGKASALSGTGPVIILENIHEAEKKAVRFFATAWQRFPARNSCHIYSTCAPVTKTEQKRSRRFEETGNEAWAKVFSRIIRFSAGDASPDYPPEVSRDLWEIAYALCLFRRYFAPAHFPGLFEASGKNPQSLYRALDILNRLGLSDFAEDPLPRINDCAARAEEILGERKEPVRAVVRGRLLAWVEEGKLRPCFNLLKALSELGGEASLTSIRDSLIGDITNGTYGEIERAIAENYFGAVVGESRLLPLRYIFKTLKALSYGDEAEIREVFAEPAPEAGGFPLYKAQILTNLTGYYFGVQDIAAAAETVKEAMMLSQRQREGRELARSYRLFSLVNLSRQRMGDALEYFSFAIENAGASGDYDELTITAYYAAGAHFLFGNIAQAERLVRQAEQAAVECGRADWADRSRFLRGRLCFEVGHYGEALEIFEGLQKQGALSSLPAAAAGRELTLAAWIFRCDVFLRNFPLRKPAVMNGDALLFEVEAAYFAAEYERTVKLADQLRAVLLDGGFLFIEQPDWRSGFAQCELLLFPHRNFLTRLLSTYRSLALCRLNHPRDNSREQAVDSMRKIIKEEGLPDTDPGEAFYCYAYYQILQESEAVEVDLNTSISMAFKRLQRRASRIDDLEIKRDFLTLNYWNNALGQTAKYYKLI